MATHVTDEVRSDAPLYELPLAAPALEPVLVAAADDGLQSQVGQGLPRTLA